MSCDTDRPRSPWMTAAIVLMAASGALSAACGDTDQSTGSSGGNAGSETGVGGDTAAAGRSSAASGNAAIGGASIAAGGNSAGTDASIGGGGTSGTGATAGTGPAGGTDAAGGQPAGDGGTTAGGAGVGGTDAEGGAGGDVGSGGDPIGSGGDGDGGMATGGASGGAAGGTGGDNPGVGGGTGGGNMVYGIDGQSCVGMTGTECNGESCCTGIEVPGGTFPMGRGTETCSDCTDGCPSQSCPDVELPEHPATVSSFVLDKYEVTVGRFRAFVDAYDGTAPAAGSGAHPLISGSGWNSAWNTSLPSDRTELTANVACNVSPPTWTNTAGANETCPMNCGSWYEAFAFCIWDGGRLPTEAEWEYAAAGGDENRVCPWGSDVTEPLPANYTGNGSWPLIAVGSYPAGNGRWGHADLAGSMHEWVLDWYASDWYTTTQAGCSDCANLTAASYRMIRGGYWLSNASDLRAAYRVSLAPINHADLIGFRCARDL